MDEVSTCTSCPKMPGKISVHKLWMHIRRLWMAIRSLWMAIRSLQTEISCLLLETFSVLAGCFQGREKGALYKFGGASSSGCTPG